MFYTIRRFAENVRIASGQRKILEAGPDDQQRIVKNALLTVVMQVLLTAVVVGAFLYAILSKRFDVSIEKGAWTLLGTVIGYWFR